MNTATNILRNWIKKGMCMIYACLILLLLLFAQACSENNTELEQNEKQASLSMNMKSVESEAIINNALLYVFDNISTPFGFIRKQQNITRTDNVLSTNSVTVGRWNFVLISSEDNISTAIKVPSPMGGNINDPMWITDKTADGNFLKQVPELRYALFNKEILEGETETANASLDRNVAKIQIIMEHNGFETPPPGLSTNAYFELYDVPTTLSWEGRLLPDAAIPTVSDKPMRKYLTFDATGKAETLDFIIPAHRPRNGSDLATNKIKLKACMMLGENPYYGKSEIPIEIEHTPEPNSIIQVYVTFSGEPDTDLDIKVTVQQWGQVEQNVEFGQ